MKRSFKFITLVLSALIFAASFPQNSKNLPLKTETSDESVAHSSSLKVEPLSYTNNGNTTYTAEDIAFEYKISDVKLSDGTSCTNLQGMHVGTTYIYTAKINVEANRCAFIRVTTKTGDVEEMDFYADTSATAPSVCTVAGNAGDIVVRSIASNGESSTYMFVATGKSVIKMLLKGNNLYYMGSFDAFDTEGNKIGFSSLKWICENNRNDYYLLKNGSTYYYAKIPQSENNGTVTCYKLFTAEHKNAIFATSNEQSSTISGIEGWTQKGFEYDYANKILYLPLFDHTTNKQNLIVTFNLNNIITDEKLSSETDSSDVVFPTVLSFIANDATDAFAIHSLGFRTGQGTAGDQKLYFNADSIDGKEGIYSFSCNRHKENFENIVTDSSLIYTIQYNGNGSTAGHTGDTVHISGIPSNLRWNYYSKEGYTFKGWYLQRKSDGLWLCENDDGTTGWYKENEMPYGTYKALLYNMDYVDALTDINGDTITCYAMWESKTPQGSFAEHTPVDMGTQFYAAVKHTDTGLFVTEQNSSLALKGASFNDNSSVFRFVRQNNGSYTIFSHSEENVWDVDSGIFVNERGIGIHPSNETDAQKFFIYYINQNFYLSPVSSDNILDVDKSGKNLCLANPDLSFGKFEILKRSLDNYALTLQSFGNNYTAYIKNGASGKLLTAKGNSIAFEDATYSNDQLWTIKQNTDGSQTIISASQNKAINVAEDSLDSGADIILNNTNSTKAQSFYFLQTTDGYTVIKPVYTNNVVDVDGNNFDVHIYPYGDGKIQQAAQKFEIIPEKADNADPVYMGSEFKGFISALSTGGIVTEEDGNVYSGATVYGPNQLFTFTYDSTLNAYTITSPSGKAVTVENTADSNGAKLILSSINGSVAQKFRIYAKDNYYYFSPVYTTKLVDLDAGDNKTLQLYDTDSSTRKRFSIIKISHNGKAPSSLDSSFTAFVKNEGSGLFIVSTDDKIASGEGESEWIFTKQLDSSYNIMNESGLFWTLSDGITTSGASISLEEQSGEKTQSFYIYEAEGGYMIQCAVNPGFITIDKSGISADTEGKDGQVFTIISAEKHQSNLVLKEGSPYTIKDGFLFGASLDTLAKDLVNAFENDMVCVFTHNGTPLEDTDKCITGYEIRLIDDAEILDTLVIVIMGDVNGNGMIDSTDYVQVKQHFYRNLTLEGAFFAAGDVDGNGMIDSTDYIQIKNMFLGHK